MTNAVAITTADELSAPATTGASTLAATLNARAAAAEAAAYAQGVTDGKAQAAFVMPTDPAGLADLLAHASTSVRQLSSGATALTPPTPAPFVANVTAVSAAAFADSIGVNTHVEYSDGKYSDMTSACNAMNSIGIKNVRDSGPQDGNQGQWIYDWWPAQVPGLKLCAMLHGTLATQIPELSALAAKHPGYIDLVEGPNEVNNGGSGDPTYGFAQNDHAGAQKYQAALYAAVKTDANLKGATVLNFTDYPDTEGKADAANFHYYPGSGQFLPSGPLKSGYASQTAVEPAVPVYVTETGARTDQVTEAQQAVYLALAYVEGFAAGVVRTYQYELVDDRDSNHWGLFREDWTPKPSATAVKTLLALGVQKGAKADANVAGASSLLLDNGVLLLWSETAVTATVSFGDTAARSVVAMDGTKTAFTGSVSVPVGVVAIAPN